MSLLFFLLFTELVADARRQYTVNELKNGKFKDDSSHICSLPFENRKKVFPVQDMIPLRANPHNCPPGFIPGLALSTCDPVSFTAAL